MKAQETIERELNDIASLLLPVSDDYLLLPGVSVAEIVGFVPPEKEADGPDWFLGFFEWRKLRVPLVSFEILDGKSQPELHENNRIAVLNNTGQSKGLPFFAILTQSTPRLMRISEQEIDSLDETVGDASMMKVRVLEDSAVIPDIVGIEKKLISHLGL